MRERTRCGRLSPKLESACGQELPFTVRASEYAQSQLRGESTCWTVLWKWVRIR